jgi:TonB family protein
MRCEFALTLIAFLPVPFAAAQQPAPPTPPQPSATPPASQTVYYAGTRVTAPEIIPGPFEIATPRRCDELDGVVRLAAVVDATGVPHEVKSLQTDDARLGTFAIELVSAERFKPGAYNGSPSPVGIETTLGLETCIQSPGKAAGSAQDILRLKATPVQTLALRTSPDGAASSGVFQVAGRNISAPVPLSSPGAKYSDYGKKKKIQGVCLIGLIVDADGVPQKVHVVKSLEPSMDQKAIEAVNSWHFKPAMLDGVTPVPVMITVEVDFHLY